MGDLGMMHKLCAHSTPRSPAVGNLGAAGGRRRQAAVAWGLREDNTGRGRRSSCGKERRAASSTAETACRGAAPPARFRNTIRGRGGVGALVLPHLLPRVAWCTLSQALRGPDLHRWHLGSGERLPRAAVKFVIYSIGRYH